MKKNKTKTILIVNFTFKKEKNSIQYTYSTKGSNQITILTSLLNKNATPNYLDHEFIFSHMN